MQSDIWTRACAMSLEEPLSELRFASACSRRNVQVKFINMLSATGVSAIEPTAFVSPKWVPQMGDHHEVLAGITPSESVAYPVLVPNLKGFQDAYKAGARHVAVISIPSKTFAEKNLNCSVEECVSRAVEIVSALFACPRHTYRPVGKRHCARPKDAWHAKIRTHTHNCAPASGCTLKLLRTVPL